MKLYHSPNACSFADLIALLDAGQRFDVEAVDIHTKRTASGADFHDINPKGYVPALMLDDGEIITENVAVLDWIADQYPALRPSGELFGNLARTRLLEMLTFISTEIHRAYKPLWHGGTEMEKQEAAETVAKLFKFAATKFHGDYLFGDRLSVADCYFFVMLRWADKFSVVVPETLLKLYCRMEALASVQAAFKYEAVLRDHSPVNINADVRENPEQHRFERTIHDAAMATAYYRLADGKLALVHTEVPTEFSGAGIATALAQGTFELLRKSGRKAVLVCPFMIHFFTTHPEYADIVEA